MLQSVKNQLPIAAAEDVLISPTYVPDLVNATLDLLLDGERGIWHIVNDSVISWADFARVITHLSDCDMNLVQGVTMDSLGYKARRPRYSALASEKGIILPQLHNAIDRFLKEMEFSVEYAADNNLVYEE